MDKGTGRLGKLTEIVTDPCRGETNLPLLEVSVLWTAYWVQAGHPHPVLSPGPGPNQHPGHTIYILQGQQMTARKLCSKDP